MSDLSLPEPVRHEQALDVQHDTDPEQDHSLARRIPHIGHALLFFSLSGFSLLGWSVVLMVIAATVYKVQLNPHSTTVAYIGGVATVLAYVMTLGISFPLFPLLWQYRFLDGIHWVWRAARLRWWKLILLGFGLSVLSQLADRFLIKSHEGSDIALLFHSPLSAWITSIFGSLLIPAFEEIAFRGFLLPAFATAYDWLSLSRTPAAVQKWQQTTSHTTGAWIFSTIVTTVFFVLLHAMQLHGSYSAMSVLVLPSIVFCIVRIRTRSVAAASIVHASYDALIFIELFVQTGAFHHLDKLGS